MIHIVTTEREPLVCIHRVRNLVFMTADFEDTICIYDSRPDVLKVITDTLKGLHIPHDVWSNEDAAGVCTFVSLASTDFSMEATVEDEIIIYKGKNSCEAMSSEKFLSTLPFLEGCYTLARY